MRQARFHLSQALGLAILLSLLTLFVGCAGIKAATPGGNDGGGNNGDNNGGGGGTTPQPNVASFTATPTAVDSGQTATLTWTTQNATAVTLDGAAVDLNGSKTVTVASTTTYTLAATGATGTTPANKTLTVTVNPKIVSFTAKPATVGIGQSTTLTWETTGATSVTLNGEAVNAKGNASKVITQDTTFTLTASGGAQPVSQSIDIKATTATLKTSVNHIIMMMQENRSFDHYFGHLNDYRAKQGLPTDVDDLAKATATPNPSWCAYNNGSCSGPATVTPYRMNTACIGDLSSSWQEAHNDINLHSPNEGSWGDPAPMNGFAAMAGGFADHDPTRGGFDVVGKRAMGYYEADQLPFYYWAATTFATSDRWFSGALTRTQPNRMYFLAATSNGYAFPGNDGTHPDMNVNSVKNIFQLLDAAGVSWKVYVTDGWAPGKTGSTYMNYFYDFTSKHIDNFVDAKQFAIDAQNGTLPQVAMIESGYVEAPTTDEHPQNDISVGAKYVRSFVTALMNSPSWKDSIFFLTYDEGGGFYDHVPPMKTVNPDGKKPYLAAGDPTGDFDYTGFRVPLMMFSPFAKPGYVSHSPADFTALLKFIQKRWDLPNLNQRDAAQPDMEEYFDWTAPNILSVNPPEQPKLDCYYDRLP